MDTMMDCARERGSDRKRKEDDQGGVHPHRRSLRLSVLYPQNLLFFYPFLLFFFTFLDLLFLSPFLNSTPSLRHLINPPVRHLDKIFPAVTLVTGPYRVELRIVYERDVERRRGAGNAQNNASAAAAAVGNISDSR